MPCQLMPGTTNVITRLITMRPITQRVSMFSLLPTTNVAPNKPNTAPDAPAVWAPSGDNRYTTTDPPSALMKYSAMNRTRPNAASSGVRPPTAPTC